MDNDVAGPHSKRSVWHTAFECVLSDRSPSSVEVNPEYQLTAEPQRADVVLVRQKKQENKDSGQILRHLWALIPEFAVLEFKSIASGLALTDWSVLFGYTHQFIARNRQTPLQAHKIATVMVVPSLTPTIGAELERLGLLLCPLEGGYYLVEKALFPSYLVVTDEVCLSEEDPVLGLFAHRSIAKKLGPVPSSVATLVKAYLSKEDIDMNALEGADELWERFAEDLPAHILRSKLHKLKPQERLEGLKPQERLEGLNPQERLEGLKPQERLEGLKPQERLEGLKPQERLEGLKPQERLEGLSQDELILALPDDILRLQPQELIDTLSPQTQELIRNRLNT